MTVSDQKSLPKHWVTTTLDEVCLPILKANPKDDPNGYIKYIDIGSINNATNTIDGFQEFDWKSAPSRARQIVHGGDTLFSTVRTYLKNIAQVPEFLDGQIASTGFSVIRPNAGINSRFIFHLTRRQEFLVPLNELQRGTSYPAVRNEDVLSQPIPIAPFNEQRRIVAKIEELFSKLDAGVAALEKAKALLKQYRQSVLKAAVTGDLSRDWREANRDKLEPADQLLKRILAERRRKWEEAELAKMRAKGKEPTDDKWKAKYKEPQPPDTEGLPDLPEGWCWATLPQLGDLNRGKSKHRPRNAPKLYGGSYPFIQTGDVRSANGVLRTYSQTYSDVGLAQSRLWPAGTMCITIAANIAETAILGFDSCFPDSIVGFLTDEHWANIRFYELFLRVAREDLDRYAPATAQKNINLEILSDLAVPMPSLEEQSMIFEEADAKLSVADVVEDNLEGQVARNDDLRQSILHQAFTGQLVPQDPNDEPASVLLERIKAERAAQGDGKATRGRGRGKKAN